MPDDLQLATSPGVQKPAMATSQPMRQLSTVIIAQDEAECISNAICSCLSFSDEIIVIDGGSKDATVEIATDLGAKVYHNPWPGYAKQRNYGADQATHNWIFFIDADEIVGQKLAVSIQAWKAQPEPQAIAFSVNRVGDFLGKWLDSRPDSETLIRLYDKTQVRIKEVVVHEGPDVGDAPVAKLPGIVWHQGFRTMEDIVIRFNKYTDLDAQKSYLAGKKFSLFRLLFKPHAKFFQKYIWHGMYRQGVVGFSVAVLWSFYAYLWEMKLYEIYWQKSGGKAPEPKD
jgi:glycosyltransferase involved in cell wall biosynthesis